MAQVRWEDLVITGGLSGEAYRGNLPSVTISAVDSTESASAGIGQVGMRGRVLLFNRPERSLDVLFDAGLRQFYAAGFKVRDYAPREWVGSGDLGYTQTLEGLGTLQIRGGLAGRRVEDRPPAPLYIQPAYMTVDGRIGLNLLPIRGVYLDTELVGEVSDYPTDAIAPQLDLLDRKMVGIEAGVVWGSDWTARVNGAFGLSFYRNQATFDSSDPHRRDRTTTIGASWTKTSRYIAQLGVEGTFNRSNSRRPEYNALSISAVVSAPLPRDLSLTFYLDLTDKSYLADTDFARLVPGEEADNASVIYLELGRPLLVNLDGALRVGWTRAETDIGDSYSERYGATLLLRYRPLR